MATTPKRANIQAQPSTRFASEILAENVRVARTFARFSQDKLADAMQKRGYNWTRATVSEVERNGRSVGTDELVALALILSRTVPSLLDPRGLDGQNPNGLDIGGVTLAGPKAAAWIGNKL